MIISNRTLAMVGVGIAVLFATSPVLGQSSYDLITPDWMVVDNDAKTVTLTVESGSAEANNGWNFNGFINGEATLVVPVGYNISLTFVNKDAVMSHSVGIGELPETFPPIFETVVPVFEGAVTSNPTDMSSATASGATETISFVASKAGEFAMICYIPAHALTGMWIGFTVSEAGEVGLITK